MPVALVVGVVYILGSLGVLFSLVPKVWWCEWLNLDRDNMGNQALLVLLELAVAGVLGYLAYRLTGPTPTPGLRAGLFVILFSLFLVILLTRLVSTWIEYFVYETQVLPEPWGIGLTGAFGIGLVVLLFRFFFLRPDWQRWLIGFEEQGWFSTRSYKRSQGQRVRRGTIVGILALAGAGIYILVAHRTLDTGSKDWAINIPFTAWVTVTDPGDAAKAFPEQFPESEKELTIGLKTFLGSNKKLKEDWIQIDKPRESDFHPGEVVKKKTFEEARENLRAKIDPKLDEAARQREEQEKLPTSKPAELAGGTVQCLSLTLLPNVALTLPLLLSALSLWGAWRVVNLPPFADFLIATEAELNKVSWTTRKRLIQDTVVVLATVLLLTVFLFFMDLFWMTVLRWKPIGVLKLDQQSTSEQEKKEASW